MQESVAMTCASLAGHVPTACQSHPPMFGAWLVFVFLVLFAAIPAAFIIAAGRRA